MQSNTYNYGRNIMTDFSKINILLGLNSPNGFSENEIADILNSFGAFPQILLDYYKELGNYDFNNWQDYLTKPYKNNYFVMGKYLINHSTDKYAIICQENQGVCFAGIKAEDLSQENPPVYFTFDKKHWEIGCNNLLNYIHGFVYTNAVTCLKFNGCFDINDNGINFIKSNFKNKNVIFNNWAVDGKNEFYGDYDDTIMMLTAETSLLYASNNKEHFMEMEDKWKGIDIINSVRLRIA
jgi:hypothetical protein